MRGSSFYSEGFFIPALFLSVSIHGLLIGVSVWIPSMPGVSVIEAPSSLEVTVISQPVVTVIEEEIVAEEIVTEGIFEEIAVDKGIEKTTSDGDVQPSVISQESRGTVTKAKPLMHVNPAPPYPRVARQKGWEGTVRLKVLVEKDGTPDHVDIQQSSGYGVLDKAALGTVRNWEFSPARSGAMRFSSRITIPIQFTLIKE